MTKKIEIELPNITKDQEEFLLFNTSNRGLERVMNLLIEDGIESSPFKRDTKGFDSFNEFYIAWFYGYTVIEPKYYIQILKNNYYGYINVANGNFDKLSIHSIEQSTTYKTQFTEDEIKCNFPQFWECRKLVEDIGVNQCED